MLGEQPSTSGPRRSLGLADIAPQYIAKSGLCATSEVESARGGSIRIRHMTGGSPSTSTMQDEGEPTRFPRLHQCAHFHYDTVELPAIKLSLYLDERHESSGELHAVQVTSHSLSWLVRRSYDNFRLLDAQLHRCIYDRRFSQLQELPEEGPKQGEEVRSLLAAYLTRFSGLTGSLLNCGPVLNWLEMDNRGRRLLASDTDDCPINTPAVAAAYAVRRYSAQAVDEISFQVGDMISVIDMPPSEESVWWRGKLGFNVGFFPGACVAVIGDKLPRSLKLPSPRMSQSREPSKPVLRRHGKLIAFFRSFILARPSRRRLKQSGILKERVFGCDLGEHLLNTGHMVPMVLKCCAEFIEAHGIVDGIYRLSGVTSNIQKLRNAFDEDRIPALYEDSSILQDIHSVASLLKMYFRELPNPLCTYQLYSAFVEAAQSSAHHKLRNMRDAVTKLPPTHYRTLCYLMTHLARVAERGHITGMTARNIAIVWAPNLLRCKELEVGGVAALQGVGIQAVVTEFLICYADLIFCDKLPPLATLPPITASPKRCRPKSLAIATPTKLLSLEEARTRVSTKSDADYIEVGGGPSQLPALYHTVIELPRKRAASNKRSPLGWRSLFKSTRKSTGETSRKISEPTNQFQSACAAHATDQHSLRPVKSAESLESAMSPPHCLAEDDTRPRQASQLAGHSRSASHDSYFDALDVTPVRHAARSSRMLEPDLDGCSLDLSEIQLNFDLEESEMRIFSEEDETLVSTSVGSTSLASNNSPRIPRVKQKTKRLPLLCNKQPPKARHEEDSSADSTPKKLKTCNTSISPTDSTRSKRSRLEEQLVSSTGELRFIDSQSPENTVQVVAEVHPLRTSTATTPDEHALPYLPLVDRDSNCSTASTTPISVDLNTQAGTSQSPSLDIPYNRMSAANMTPNSSLSGNITPTLQDRTLDSTSPDRTFESVIRSPASPVKESLITIKYGKISTPDNPVYQNLPGSPGEDPEPEVATAYENVPGPGEATAEIGVYQNLSSPIVAKADEDYEGIVYQNLPSPCAAHREEEGGEEGKRIVYQNLPSPSEGKTEDEDNFYENVEMSSSDSPTFGRDSSPPTSPDSPEVYEQVKYFRHSVSQVNQLLDEKDESQIVSDQSDKRAIDAVDNPCAVGNLIQLDSPQNPDNVNRSVCDSDLAQEILDALDLRRESAESAVVVTDLDEDSADLVSRPETLEVFESVFETKCDLLQSEARELSVENSGQDILEPEIVRFVLEPAKPREPESLEDFLSGSDAVKRRLESEIGRDIVRDRRMRHELEQIRTNKKQAGIKELLSMFEPTKTLASDNAPTSPTASDEPKSPVKKTSSKTDLQLNSPTKSWQDPKPKSPTKSSSDPIEIRSKSPTKQPSSRTDPPAVSPTKERIDRPWHDRSNSPTKTASKVEVHPKSPTRKGSSTFPSKTWMDKKPKSPTKPTPEEIKPKSPTKKASSKIDLQAMSPSKESKSWEVTKTSSLTRYSSREPTRPRLSTLERDWTTRSCSSPKREVFKVTLASGDFTATLPSDPSEEAGVLKPLNATEVDDAQRRARIEKYKEERRLFLREKFRVESFKPDEEVRKEERKTTPEKTFRIRNLSKSPEKSRQEPITCVTVKEKQSPDKMNVRRCSETAERFGAGSKPVRSSPTSPTKPYSSEDSTRRKSAGSPSYCIKDMAAMFEGRDSQSRQPNKHYMSSV